MQQPIALAAAFFAVGGMAQWSYTDCSQLLGGSGYVSSSILSIYTRASSLTYSPLSSSSSLTRSLLSSLSSSSTTHFPIIISSHSSQKTKQVCSPDYSTVSYCQPGLDPEVVDSQYCDYGDCWADQFNGFCTYEMSKKNQARGPTDCTQVNPEGGYVCSEDYTTLVSFFIFLLFFISFSSFFYSFADGFCVCFCSTNALVA